jgi:hypothetical protein
MKKIFFLFMTLYTCRDLSAQDFTTSTKASSIQLTYKDEKSKSRYKKNENEIICGYYSEKDNTFYNCDGSVLEKVTDKTRLKDGEGCCRDITLSGGSFEITGNATVLADGKVKIENKNITFIINDADKLEKFISRKEISATATIKATIKIE